MTAYELEREERIRQNKAIMGNAATNGQIPILNVNRTEEALTCMMLFPTISSIRSNPLQATGCISCRLFKFDMVFRDSFYGHHGAEDPL